VTKITLEDMLSRLTESLEEMLDVYWGEGDGAPEPEFIKRAKAHVEIAKAILEDAP
jgi:hypothetical protein